MRSSKPLPALDLHPRPATFEERLAGRRYPLMQAVVDARDARDWKSLRRALRAWDGFKRDSGIEPAVPQPPGFANIFHQGMLASRPRHYTH